MKIGLVTPYDITKGSGVNEHVFAVHAELNRRGHDAYIITPQPKGQKDKPEPGQKIIYLGGSTDFNSPHTTVQVSARINESIVPSR